MSTQLVSLFGFERTMSEEVMPKLCTVFVGKTKK